MTGGRSDAGTAGAGAGPRAGTAVAGFAGTVVAEAAADTTAAGVLVSADMDAGTGVEGAGRLIAMRAP